MPIGDASKPPAWKGPIWTKATPGSLRCIKAASIDMAHSCVRPSSCRTGARGAGIPSASSGVMAEVLAVKNAMPLARDQLVARAKEQQNPRARHAPDRLLHAPD